MFFKIIFTFKPAACLILFVLHFGCSHPVAQISLIPVRQHPSETTTVIMPSDSLDSVYQDLKVVGHVLRLYAKTNYRPVWIDAHHTNPSGDSLITFINNIRYYGLNKQGYHFFEINSIKNVSQGGKILLRLDALLTDAFFCISRDLHYGRLDRKALADTSSYENFRTSGGMEKYFESLEPRFENYRKLKSELKTRLDSLRNLYPLLEENQLEVSMSFFSEVQAIEINMERWRSEQEVFGDQYIFINIPSYMLYFIKNDSVVLQSKVIVGNPDTPTPELSSLIDAIVTFPYWYVPRKIAITEYLPAIQVDTSFLRENNFDVLNRKGEILDPDSVEWADFSADYFPVILRQREGAENSLGILKFVFNNPYAVFLHDTNAKRLFRKEQRAFSHGCIRMEQAVELSHYLVTGKRDRKSRLIEKFLKEQERHSITLAEPMPIYIRYFTCDVIQGKTYFYKDIYNKDRNSMKILYPETTVNGL